MCALRESSWSECMTLYPRCRTKQNRYNRGYSLFIPINVNIHTFSGRNLVCLIVVLPLTPLGMLRNIWHLHRLTILKRDKILNCGPVRDVLAGCHAVGNITLLQWSAVCEPVTVVGSKSSSDSEC